MVSIPLFDVVLSSDRADRSVAVAHQLIDGALGDLEQIETLESQLAPAGLDQFERQTVALLRGMYEQWAQNAQSLLDRIEQTRRRFGSVERTDTLRDALGRTLAMLSVSIDDMEAARRDIREGRTISGEEVRRELRLRAQ